MAKPIDPGSRIHPVARGRGYLGKRVRGKG